MPELRDEIRDILKYPICPSSKHGECSAQRDGWNCDDCDKLKTDRIFSAIRKRLPAFVSEEEKVNFRGDYYQGYIQYRKEVLAVLGGTDEKG